MGGIKTYYFSVRRNSTSLEATSEALLGVPVGNYTLLAYDLEATGQPSRRPAASESVCIGIEVADSGRDSELLFELRNSVYTCMLMLIILSRSSLLEVLIGLISYPDSNNSCQHACFCIFDSMFLHL